jgi:hypothetical protein
MNQQGERLDIRQQTVRDDGVAFRPQGSMERWGQKEGDHHRKTVFAALHKGVQDPMGDSRQAMEGQREIGCGSRGRQGYIGQPSIIIVV